MRTEEVCVGTVLKRIDGTFVPVAEVSDAASLSIEDDYLEGAISLVVGKTPVITEIEWDCVIDLWSYIVDGLEMLESADSWSTHFPDQPIRFSIKRYGHEAQVQLEYSTTIRKAVCKYSALKFALLSEAERFFSSLARILPEIGNMHRDYLDRAVRMQQQRS